MLITSSPGRQQYLSARGASSEYFCPESQILNISGRKQKIFREAIVCKIKVLSFLWAVWWKNVRGLRRYNFEATGHAHSSFWPKFTKLLRGSVESGNTSKFVGPRPRQSQKIKILFRSYLHSVLPRIKVIRHVHSFYTLSSSILVTQSRPWNVWSIHKKLLSTQFSGDTTQTTRQVLSSQWAQLIFLFSFERVCLAWLCTLSAQPLKLW